jgi:hypothetical protein
MIPTLSFKECKKQQRQVQKTTKKLRRNDEFLQIITNFIFYLDFTKYLLTISLNIQLKKELRKK